MLQGTLMKAKKKKKKKMAQEQGRRVLFQAVLPCTNRMKSSSQSLKAGIISGIILLHFTVTNMKPRG